MPTVATQQYKLPEDLEARAKILYFQLSQGQLKPEQLTQDEKILLNRWVVYTLPQERREQLGLVSPEEFDRMYPPPWAPKRGAGRAFLEGVLQELTLGSAKPQAPPQTVPEKIARYAGQFAGMLPWYLPGMPLMRAGGLLASRLIPALVKRELAPITASVVREAGAAAGHYLAKQSISGEPATIEGLLEYVGSAALGARLILPRATAGHIAGTLSRHLKAETDEFVKAGVQPDEALKQATERVANQVRELAEGIKTGRYGEREVSKLLGTTISWNFVSPKDLARYLEELADKGIKAVPRVIIPKHGVQPGGRPPYAAQVAGVLRRAKEPPTSTTQATPTVAPEIEALAAQLGISPVTRQMPEAGTLVAPARAQAAEAEYFQALLRELGLKEKTAPTTKPRQPKPKQPTTTVKQPTPTKVTPTTNVQTGVLTSRAVVDKQASELQRLGYTTAKKLRDIEMQDKVRITTEAGEQLQDMFVERIWTKARRPSYVLLAQYNNKTGKRTFYLYDINQIRIEK